jgi:uncharacterized protein
MLPRNHYLKQIFQDPTHFPDGFEKGGLSDIQARLVRKQGALINALIADEVADPTSEDLHILKVIANLSTPKNPAEQAWVKYQSVVKAKQASAPSKARSSKPKAAKTETPAEPAPAKKAAKATPKTAAKAAVKTPKATTKTSESV